MRGENLKLKFILENI